MPLARRTVLLAALAAAPAAAQSQPPAINLAPVAHAAHGLTGAGGTLRLSADQATLAFTLNYWNLSGPATALRLDGPEPLVIAMAGSQPAASPLSGRVALTPAQMQALRAGRLTFAVATAAFPQGEITGPAAV